jgi:hypothetical protein
MQAGFIPPEFENLGLMTLYGKAGISRGFRALGVAHRFLNALT